MFPSTFIALSHFPLAPNHLLPFPPSPPIHSHRLDPAPTTSNLCTNLEDVLVFLHDILPRWLHLRPQCHVVRAGPETLQHTGSQATGKAIIVPMPFTIWKPDWFIRNFNFGAESRIDFSEAFISFFEEFSVDFPNEMSKEIVKTPVKPF